MAQEQKKERRNMKNFLYLLLIPSITEKLDLQHFGEKRLLKYNFLQLSDAILYYSFNPRSDMFSLKDWVCTYVAPYALLLVIKTDVPGFNHNLSHQNWHLTSPRGIITNNFPKKSIKPVLCVIPEAFMPVFPNADKKMLEMYLRPGIEIYRIDQLCNEYSQYLHWHDGAWYVRNTDRYPVGNPLQAFDFLQYLGFDLPNSLIQTFEME